MPRYHFSIYDDHEVVDNTSFDLENIDEARLRMVSFSREWAGRETRLRKRLYMEACDEHGKVVGFMQFSQSEENED